MKHRAMWGCVALAAATFAGAAQAQAAFTATAVHLRAGPAPDYPVVAVLPAGYQVAVQGCLGDYSWCDVLAGPERGWIYAANIHYPYQNTYVPVLTYGAVIGIGVLTFVLNDYWPHHYHDRPWYAQRERWNWRPAPPPHYAPPRHPAPHAPQRPPYGEDRPRPQLPTPPGFVGPGGQLNPPPSHGTRPGLGEVRPPRPHDGLSRGQRDERREERRGDRRGDR